MSNMSQYPTDAQVGEKKHGAVARAIAAELSTLTGAAWSPVIKWDTGFYLRRADGLAVSLHSSFGGAGKWHASMSYGECVPNLQDYYPSAYAQDQTGRTSVNIAQSKTPKQIAGEVNRRLVAAIEPAFAEALKQHAQTEGWGRTTHDNLTAIAQVLGVGSEVPVMEPTRPRSYDPKINNISGSRHGLKVNYADISAHGDNTVTLKLMGVPHDVALQIARLLKGGE